FQLHRRDGDVAWLGAGAADLLVLHERPGARRHLRGVTGLYHFAVLTPSRLALARSLQHLADTQTPLQGFADHLVSEAIYLADPDGNGIEIYRDRPRSEWPRRNGQVQMASDPLDIEGILAELRGQDAPWTGLDPETTIGHMHLHVADLEAAEAFYVGVLGFELIARLSHSAGFVSAGGYHHHIGYNVWAGVGAPPPPPDAVGLRWYEIRLPDAAALDQVVDRLRQANRPLEEQPAGFFVRDPAQNGILLTTA
ncbi:MAG: VOC family protein, partial [Chloroflexi bacterium]|nr:VOC family protein [Chloroflexota bacterium]